MLPQRIAIVKAELMIAVLPTPGRLTQQWVIGGKRAARLPCQAARLADPSFPRPCSPVWVHLRLHL